MCSCPERKGVFPIAQADQSNIVDGAPVAGRFAANVVPALTYFVGYRTEALLVSPKRHSPRKAGCEAKTCSELY